MAGRRNRLNWWGRWGLLGAAVVLAGVMAWGWGKEGPTLMCAQRHSSLLLRSYEGHFLVMAAWSGVRETDVRWRGAQFRYTHDPGRRISRPLWARLRGNWAFAPPNQSALSGLPMRVRLLFPIWWPLVATLSFCAVAWVVWWRRRTERGCAACGYSLAGLPAGAVCPECGSEGSRPDRSRDGYR